MKDLQVKTEKLTIKQKTASAKRNGALSPHVTYGVTSPSTAINSARGNAQKRFSMTVSFFNPKFEKNVYPKDFAIRHEAKRQQFLATGSLTERARSPKRDPILQDNGEAPRESRPIVRRHPESDRMAINTEEPVYSKKAVTEFSSIMHARSLSPRRPEKIEGIRAFTARVHEDISPRKPYKEVKSPHKVKANPITEGDVDGIKLITVRLPPPISEETQRLNDRMFKLSSDIGANSKGRVFRDCNIKFDTEPESWQDECYSPVMSPFHSHNNGDGMRDTIQYKSALSYRDQGVTGKCTNLAFSEIVRPVEN